MDFKVSSYSEKQNLKLKENQRMFRIFQAKKYRTDSNTLVTILQIFERTQKVFLQINTPVTAFLVMQAVFRVPLKKANTKTIEGNKLGWHSAEKYWPAQWHLRGLISEKQLRLGQSQKHRCHA